MCKKYLKAVLCTVLGSTIALSSVATAFASENDASEILSYVKVVDGQTVLIKNKDIESEKTTFNTPLLKSSALPSSYNLADEGYVSDIRNQNPYGSCWSFAALASMESNLIKSENADKNIDLSEKHLVYFNYNGADSSSDKSLFAGKDTYSSLGYSPFLLGGNPLMASTTLMRRYGAVDEEKVPYEFSNGTTVDASFKNESDIYLKDFYFLPETVEFEYDDYGQVTSQTLYDDSTVANAINTIKEYMLEYGALASSFYASDAMSGYGTDEYWNNSKNCYYFDASTSNQLPNHGITIVGWDDNYSKNNFSITPPKDGAWIIKNSWGDNWGNNGYFYLSYYDLSINMTSVFIAEDAKYTSDGTTIHEYENIYQYDGVGYGGGQVYSLTNNFKAGNFFTARDNEVLEAISTSSSYGNINVEYQVYTDLTSTVNPTLGTLVAEGSKYFELAGNYTIPLDNPVKLDKDEQYSIVIKITFNSNGSKYTILPCETQISNYVDIDVSSGQSSYCTMGSWKRITSSTTVSGCNIGNAIVKAYTNDILFGDIDCDNNINVKDATLLQKYIASLEKLDDKQQIFADANNNGSIDINDATTIQKISASII
ncbi:MAG: C1 family peptidase [Ruminococcus sp.]|nr:C1 family peptidase [Ruminococcus sp.]